MRYKLLGRSGLRVSELALGTMTFGKEWGTGADAAESARIFERYAEAGGNFLDTANRYTEGTSERLVGEFVRANRGHFVVATKYSLMTRRDDPNFSGNHRKNMVQALEASLRQMDLECVDLYWLHAWDYTTPIDEVLRGLDDLVRAGKVHYVGISDTPAWIVSAANVMAELRGWSRFVGLQLRYSLMDRTPERDLLPMARHFDLGVTCWSVLGAGTLSGKYNENPQTVGRAAKGAATIERNLRIAQLVRECSAELGCAPTQLALAWVRQQPGVMIPLLGARTAAQLEENLGALDLRIPDAMMARLDEATRPELGFPHDFLASEGVQEVLFGGTRALIDNHRGWS